jgi:hypothetical protein
MTNKKLPLPLPKVNSIQKNYHIPNCNKITVIFHPTQNSIIISNKNSPQPFSQTTQQKNSTPPFNPIQKTLAFPLVTKTIINNIKKKFSTKSNFQTKRIFPFLVLGFGHVIRFFFRQRIPCG